MYRLLNSINGGKRWVPTLESGISIDQYHFWKGLKIMSSIDILGHLIHKWDNIV